MAERESRESRGGLGRRLWRLALAGALGVPILGYVYLLNPGLAYILAGVILLSAPVLPRRHSLLSGLYAFAAIGLLLIGLNFNITMYRMADGIAPRLTWILFWGFFVHLILVRTAALGRIVSATYITFAVLPALFIGDLPLLFRLAGFAGWLVATIIAFKRSWRPGSALAWALGWLLIGNIGINAAFYIATWPLPDDADAGCARTLISYERNPEFAGHLRFAITGCADQQLFVGAKSDTGKSYLFVLNPQKPGQYSTLPMPGSISDNLVAVCDPEQGDPFLWITDQRRNLLLKIDPHKTAVTGEIPLLGSRNGLIARDEINGRLFIAQDLSQQVLACGADGKPLRLVDLGQPNLDLIADPYDGLVRQVGEPGKLVSFSSARPFDIASCIDLEGITRDKTAIGSTAEPCPEKGRRRIDRYQLCLGEPDSVRRRRPLFVSRMFAGTVSDINLARDLPRTERMADLGRGVRHMAYVSGDNPGLLVANFLTGEITLLDADLMPVSSINLGPRARWISLGRDNSMAYVTTGAGVFEIDIAKMRER